jgi:hypothetical protein
VGLVHAQPYTVTFMPPEQDIWPGPSERPRGAGWPSTKAYVLQDPRVLVETEKVVLRQSKILRQRGRTEVIMREPFFFGWTGVCTQGFSLTEQTFYHLSHTSSPFCSTYFGDTVS